MSSEVKHDTDQQQFLIERDGDPAVLKYDVDGATINMFSTYVPNEARGQGLAQRLAKSALNYARDKGYKVQPSCWFVAKYIEAKPEYQDLLV